MRLESMQDVLHNQMRDVLNAEKQLTKALPKMAKAARSEALADSFTEHLAETETQIERLEQCFEILGKRAQGKHCHGMEGLLKEGDEAMEAEGEDALVDSELIAAAQRVEHYEIAAYGCMVEYAEKLGLSEIATLLQETLAEEKAADKKLTRVNEQEIAGSAYSIGMEMAGAGAASGGRSNGGSSRSSNGGSESSSSGRSGSGTGSNASGRSPSRGRKS